MHDLYFRMGTQSLRAGRSILLGPGGLVLIDLAVVHLTRKFLVGLNEAGQRGLQFGVGEGEGCIGPKQFF